MSLFWQIWLALTYVKERTSQNMEGTLNKIRLKLNQMHGENLSIEISKSEEILEILKLFHNKSTH